jgi:hypothetical protein
MANPTLNLSALAQLVQDTHKHSAENRTLIMAVLWVAVGVAITLLIGLGAMVQAFVAERTTSYQSLVDKISEQNIKIDLLYEEMRGAQQQAVPVAPTPSTTKN